MSAFGRPAVQSRNEEGDLLQNKLVQRQIRDRLAQSAVLELKVSFRRSTCSVFSPPNSWRHR
jgi:hypothetical protein